MSQWGIRNILWEAISAMAMHLEILISIMYLFLKNKNKSSIFATCKSQMLKNYLCSTISNSDFLFNAEKIHIQIYVRRTEMVC